MENWSLLALIPLTFVTRLHGEEGGTLQGNKNLLRPGKPTGRCWWLAPCWRNASKHSASPPLGHGQMFATTPRAGTNQEGDLRSRVAGAVGPPTRGRPPISVPFTESKWLLLTGHFPGPWSRYLGRLPLILTWGLQQTWGWTLSTSCRS